MVIQESETVQVEGEDTWGVVVGAMEEDFEWVAGESDEDSDTVVIQASESEPMYIVALHSGASAVYSEDELEVFDREPKIDPEKMPEQAKEAELAEVYWQMDIGELDDYEALQSAKHSMVESEELVNIRGVDDPHVGFDDWPNGWDRGSLLDFWSTVGGTWRSCFARMTLHFSPNMARRFCAASKDELLGTERWRNRF